MPKPYLFLVPVLGLAAVTGSVGAVGMAGLTLGGGRTLRCYGRILSISTLSADGDHARTGIGDITGLADALDVRTLVREFASA